MVNCIKILYNLREMFEVELMVGWDDFGKNDKLFYMPLPQFLLLFD